MAKQIRGSKNSTYGVIATKICIIYDSKYGNTKLVAQQIADGLKEVPRIETMIGYVKEVEEKKFVDCDVMIIGAPNHMGKPSRAITKFVDDFPEFDLKAKWVAVFDTYFQRQRYFEKAMEKLEYHIKKKLPDVKVITHGLSIKVNGVNGPIADGELPKAKAFGKKIGCLLIG